MKQNRLKLKTEEGKGEEEEVEINTKKETETFHVPKTSPDKEQAYVDVISSIVIIS